MGRRRATCTAALAVGLLSACHANPIMPVAQPQDFGTQALDANSGGGLADNMAIHPSVAFARPQAFAITPQTQPFLTALTRTVEPQRIALAQRLMADPQVMNGLAGWERAGGASQLAVLKRVAAATGSVMHFQVPPIIENTGDPEQPGMMAYFQPDPKGLGHVVLYPRTISKGGKYLALATVVHEMRHAAQFQLTYSRSAATQPDGSVLALAYGAAWQAMNERGGETTMAYGDYAHLNVEFDAFQTGNEVANLVSQGAFDGTGCGFIDTQYRKNGVPALRLLPMMDQLSGAALIATVNKAEFLADQAVGQRMAMVRHPVTTMMPPMPMPAR